MIFYFFPQIFGAHIGGIPRVDIVKSAKIVGAISHHLFFNIKYLNGFLGGTMEEMFISCNWQSVHGIFWNSVTFKQHQTGQCCVVQLCFGDILPFSFAYDCDADKPRIIFLFPNRPGVLRRTKITADRFQTNEMIWNSTVLKAKVFGKLRNINSASMLFLKAWQQKKSSSLFTCIFM